jgi:hypothetical protein
LQDIIANFEKTLLCILSQQYKPASVGRFAKIIANFEAMFTSVSQVIVQSPPGRFWQVKKQHLPSWQSNSLGYKKNSP